MGRLVLPILRCISLFTIFSLFISAHAFPLVHSDTLHSRSFIISNTTGTPQVINTDTNEFVTQSLATDGSGDGFDVPAIIWLAFCLVFGVPLVFAGVWGLKHKISATRAIVLGLVFAICSNHLIDTPSVAWSALTNTLSSTPSISDILLTAATLGFFALGVLLGLSSFTKHLATIALGILGGLSFGIRVVLLRQGLLFGGVETGEYAANWIIVGITGLLGGIALFCKRSKRLGLAVACASTGTFLTFLGVDLILNKQTGMSTGLRFLFDRNKAHLIDIMQRGYNPTLSTIILLAVSLGLTPIMGYIQYHFFPPPPLSSDSTLDSEKSSIPENDEIAPLPPPPKMTALVKERRSFFSEMWDAARFKGTSPNRFSL
ncbi:hypothetical protein BDQ17DRAFT_1321645 [Cyathus striatus]|nr:hypothetical protein BDQ17DRAFT_1321645 [Cyathus striatus]